jgi:anti-anti-sigma regulatory factor
MTPREDLPSMLARPTATGTAGSEMTLVPAAADTRAELRTVEAALPRRQLRMDLRVTRNSLQLRLAGAFDAGSADRLQAVLFSLDKLDQPVHVDAAQVTSIHASDLVPLIEAAQRRKNRRLAPLVLTALSESLAQLLAEVQTPVAELKDPANWPLGQLADTTAPVRQKGHLRLLPGYRQPDGSR